MSGEINGTTIILENATGAIVGQMEVTAAFAGTPIDISNKSAGDFVTLMADAVAGQQMSISGTLVYNDNTQYRATRTAYFAGSQEVYTLTYTSNATTDEAFAPIMMVSAMSDAIPHGDKVATTITFVSSGDINRTAPVT